jgi:hypothetical protein
MTASWELITCTVALGITVIINIASSRGWFGMKSAGEVSDSLRLKAIPIGFMFTIWPAIYAGITLTWVVSYIFSSILPSQIVWYFLASCVFNCGWTFAFGYERIVVSYILLVALWGSLACINFIIWVNWALGTIGTELWIIWSYCVTFSVYFGWVTAAWLLSLFSVVFSSTEMPREYERVLFFVLAPVIYVPIAISVVLGNYSFPAAIVWGLIGIIAKNSQDRPLELEEGMEGSQVEKMDREVSRSIVMTSVILILVTLLTVPARWYAFNGLY